MKNGLFIVVVFWIFAVVNTISPGGRAELQVAVELTGELPDAQTFEGIATYVITNRGDAPVDHLRVLLFPNQFSVPPESIPEYALPWMYPSGFSQGNMHIREALFKGLSGVEKPLSFSAADRGPGAFEGITAVCALPSRIKNGESATVRISFEVRIPERRGRFGTYDDVITLAGGWFPRLLPVADSPFVAPLPISLNAVVRIPKEYGAFALNQIFPLSSEAQKISFRGDDVTEAALVLMKRMEVVSKETSGGKIVFITNEYTGLADTEKTPHRLLQGASKRARNGRARHVERVMQIADRVRTLFSPPRDIPLTILEVPVWDRLVQVSGSAILLSNRAMQLVPHPKALLFHEVDIAKNVAMILVQPSVQKEGKAASFVAEILGYQYQKRYMEQISNQKEDLAQLLKGVAFNPYIDNLIYAPQVPFKYLYSRSIEEEDWFRDELWRCVNALPRGKRILAKLEDLLGREKTNAFFSAYLQSDSTFSEALDAALKDNGRFRAQWFGEYPRISYAVAYTSSTPQQNGYRHEVKIVKSGEPVVEPVTVLFTDKKGAQQRVVWNGEGMTTVLSWESENDLKRVQLDPDYRLVETAQTQGHPLSDNTVPQRMRPPLLTQLLVWADSVTMEPFVIASFSFRRQFDISNSFHIQGAYTPRLVGGALSYYRHFGYNRTLNSRVWYAGPQLGVYKYLDASEAELQIPNENRYTATMASIAMTAGMDNRQYELDPLSGKSFQIGFVYAAGRSQYHEWVQHAKGSVRVFKNVTMTLRHSFAFYSGVSAVVGTPPASNLSTLSHRQVLRGFDLGETYGKLGIYGVMEYRHTLIGATSVSFPFRTLLDRIQGVLFVGAGSASLPQNYDMLFSKNRNFAEVGYGLRFHLLMLGVVPYLIAVDFAVPVYPIERHYSQLNDAGERVDTPRSPFRFVVGITQTY